MSLKDHPCLAFARRCTYRPGPGRMAFFTTAAGNAACPTCGTLLQVTRRGTIRPHMDYRSPHEKGRPAS